MILRLHADSGRTRTHSATALAGSQNGEAGPRATPAAWSATPAHRCAMR